MDPDIPAPSIEEESLPHRDKQNARPPFASPAIKVNHHNPIHQNNAAAVPLPPSSPMRTPYRSPSASNLKTKSSSPRTPSRSPSVASSYRDDKRQSTPVLVSKRSTSSLSAARGTTPAFRRASSNLNPASPVPYGKMAVPHEKPQLTPSSVAKEYFGKELEAHASLQSPLAVIVHDACYGHRFSRPRTTKNALATIVERPERIHATLLGASTAYVRLGGRHAEGQHAPRPKHNPQHVREIPFQIRKTSRNLPLTHPSVAFVHGSKWMEELQIMCDTAEGKLAMNGKELARPIGYGKDENGSPLPKLHEGDLYLCRESLAAFQGCLGGVCDAVDTVFSSDTTRRAFVCIRPPGHHCSTNFPSGFCWLNNVHVGIAYAAMTHGLTHAAIIDFDLHHGDGSQNIAWAQNRKAHTAAKNAASHKKIPIGYYSLHDINSYPCEWGDEEKVQKASLCIENAHGQSIWNVHLEPWNSLEEFWQLYETKYTILLHKARIFLRHHTARLRAAGNQSPRAAIFISAGFDASEWEGAGMQRHSVNVPTEFYARFTADIVKLAHEENLGVDDRVISVLEGGYSDRALTSGVLSHICGFSGNREGAANGHGLSVAGDNKFQTINNWIAESVSNSYLPDWWALQNLEELEAVVAGRQPPTAKSLKDKTGNYSSPTQASTLKMTDHARERHSLSALQARLGSESEYTPPPPDVDWAVASYELSRIIIPGDRQTQSCTHEELNAEAARARRERQSTVGVPAGPDERMQLRDRKAKLPPPPPIPSTRVASRNEHRRTTIAAISDLPDPSMQGVESAMTRPRRRSSDASSILSSFQNMKLSEAGGADTTAPANHVTSSRAGSVMTEKSTKAVAIKKTRAPVTTKTTAKLKSSPRKPKAMPPPDGSVNGGALSSKPSVIDEKKVLGGGEKRDFSNPSRSGSADEVDSLTNGVKKISIKLNMTTAEKNAAKEQHRAADEKQKKPRAPRKSAVPKTTKLTKLNSSTAPGNTAPVEAQTIKTEKTTNQPMLIPPAFVDPNSQGFALPSASPVEPNPNHSVSDPSASQPPSSWPQSNNPPDLQQTFEIANVPPQEKTMAPPGQAIVVPVGPVQQTSNAPKPFEHFQIAREQPPAPVYQMMQTSAEANPPRPTSAGLSTPRHTKQDLPVFTSSSPIPFAVPPNARVDDITMEEPKDG